MRHDSRSLSDWRIGHALSKCRQRCFVFCVVIQLLSLRPAAAQKPPGLGYVFPPTLRAGESSTVALGGYDFTVDLQWFVHDERIQLQVNGLPGDYLIPPPPYWFGPRTSLPAMPIPREVAATISVPADQPDGLIRWQVANANGASETAVFYVGTGNEIVEKRSRDLPQELTTLPVAVSGRLSRLTEVDRYSLRAERDGLISVELMARRLGSDFNGVLQVHDSTKKKIADFVDTQGLDGSVTFFAKSGHTYTISLNDLDFRGDRAYVYRLAFATGPRVLGTLPAMVPRGASLEVEFLGPGLSSSFLRTGASEIETLKEFVTVTPDSTQTTQRHVLKTTAGDVTVELPISDLPETVRLGVDGTVTVPGAVTGRFVDPGETHHYSFPVAMGEWWAIDMQSRSLNSDLDVALEILDSDGKLVHDNDDGPINSDPSLRFQATTTGTLTAAVRAISHAESSANNIYRIQFGRLAHDYALTVPQQISLPLGGKAEFTVQASRIAGFDGEIRLTPELLPEGVSATGDWLIPSGKNEAKVSLEATKDAAVIAKLIRIAGKAMSQSNELIRTAMASSGAILNPRNADDRHIPQILLAMTMPAPIEVLVVDKERQRDVHRGTTYLAELELVRKDGFAGEIKLEMTAKQDRQRMGTLGPILTVPADQNRAWYPVFLPEWLPTDLTRRIIVHGVVAVPDPKGTIRYLTKPGNARITMIMEGALMKLTAGNVDAVAKTGSVVEIPVTVSRSPKLSLPVTVRLEVPWEAKDCLNAEPVILAADQDSAMLRIQTVNDSGLTGQWSLTLTATALQDEKWPVVSQTDVKVEFTSP